LAASSSSGYEWSIATVVLYIDIHLAAIDESFNQFEIISIYGIN
jgi:hypothetical protein